MAPTPTHEAGRRVRPNAAGLSNTDAMRRMIRSWVGMAEPVALADTGSGGDGLRRS